MMQRLLSIVLFAAASLASPGAVCAQAPLPTTQVLATLTVKADAARPELMTVMPTEVRDTVKLYLDGKIQQWYSKSDGRGVVFVLNCTSVAEAKALTDQLPLVKGGFATFEFTALAPLSPLRILLAEPAAPAKDDRQQ